MVPSANKIKSDTFTQKHHTRLQNLLSSSIAHKRKTSNQDLSCPDDYIYISLDVTSDSNGKVTSINMAKNS